MQQKLGLHAGQRNLRERGHGGSRGEIVCLNQGWLRTESVGYTRGTMSQARGDRDLRDR